MTLISDNMNKQLSKTKKNNPVDTHSVQKQEKDTQQNDIRAKYMNKLNKIKAKKQAREREGTATFVSSKYKVTEDAISLLVCQDIILNIFSRHSIQDMYTNILEYRSMLLEGD